VRNCVDCGMPQYDRDTEREREKERDYVQAGEEVIAAVLREI